MEELLEEGADFGAVRVAEEGRVAAVQGDFLFRAAGRRARDQLVCADLQQIDR